MATEAPEVAATGNAGERLPGNSGYQSADVGNGAGMTITDAPETVDGTVDGGASDAAEDTSEPHDPTAAGPLDGSGDTGPAAPAGDPAVAAPGGGAAGAGDGDAGAGGRDGARAVGTVSDDAVAEEAGAGADGEPVDAAERVNGADPAAGGTWDGFAAARAASRAAEHPVDGAGGMAYPDGVGPDGDGGLATVQAATYDDGVDPAYAVDPGPAADPRLGADAADAGSTDAAYLVDETGPDGPPQADPPGSLAAVVAEHLAGPPPDGQLPDTRSDAAQAVLDVLRASGWSDTTETAELKAEVERLRELLDMVVRDHRARVATAANGQHEQAHWLVPLLRAAHGVAFGTLGAKVHLRTAVQDVPPDVLASAGLRIDDAGPAPAPEYQPEYR